MSLFNWQCFFFMVAQKIIVHLATSWCLRIDGILQAVYYFVSYKMKNSEIIHL